jgi:hypothetical protein
VDAVADVVVTAVVEVVGAGRAESPPPPPQAVSAIASASACMERERVKDFKENLQAIFYRGETALRPHAARTAFRCLYPQDIFLDRASNEKFILELIFGRHIARD